MPKSVCHAPFIAPCLLLRVAMAAGLDNATRFGPHAGLCGSDVPCWSVYGNGVKFHCRATGPRSGTGVLLLHGFLGWSKWYIPLLRNWSRTNKPWRAVACDFRGYSPEARPLNYTFYTVDHLQDDVLRIADSFRFSQFHLVGHDLGAVLGWYVAYNHPNRVLSYSAFSVPHTSAWSTALHGPNADEETQAKYNYAHQFSLLDSATRSTTSMTMFDIIGGSFENAAWLQTALWWYASTLGKIISQPPVLENSQITRYAAGNSWVAQARLMIPLPMRPSANASDLIGVVSVPVLVVCGSNDEYGKCHGMGALYEQGGQYCTGMYRYLLVQCGHDFFHSGDNNCTSINETYKVIAAVNDLIEYVEARRPTNADSAVGASTTNKRIVPGALVGGSVAAVTHVLLFVMAISWTMLGITLE